MNDDLQIALVEKIYEGFRQWASETTCELPMEVRYGLGMQILEEFFEDLPSDKKAKEFSIEVNKAIKQWLKNNRDEFSD